MNLFKKGRIRDFFDSIEEGLMLPFKKKRIRSYLDSIERERWSPFEILLEQSISGQLLEEISRRGITRASCYIDFLDDYKCIIIQGRYRSYYIELEIEPEEFSIACDLGEPDDHSYFKLEYPEQIYATLDAELLALGEK